jgi:hypothetical protein
MKSKTKAAIEYSNCRERNVSYFLHTDHEPTAWKWRGRSDQSIIDRASSASGIDHRWQLIRFWGLNSALIASSAQFVPRSN